MDSDLPPPIEAPLDASQLEPAPRHSPGHVDSLGDPSPLVTAARRSPLDLDRIEADLADVEVALARLDAGTYWIDEVTGQPLPDELLAEQPTLRRAAG
jgi:hypothetical protein